MKLLRVGFASVIALASSVAPAAIASLFPPQLTSTVVWSEEAALSPAIASDGHEYLAAWCSKRTNENGALVAARLHADGSVRERFVIAEEVPDNGPAVAPSRGNYMIVWRKGTAVYERIISAAGELAPVRTVVPAWAEGRVTVAGNKNGMMVAWVERVPLQDFTTIQIAEYDEDLERRGQLLATDESLRAGVPVIDWPAIGASERNFLLVWNESGIDSRQRRKSLRSNTHRINGGVNGDATAIAGRTRQAAEQHSPIVAWNADYYLVSWTDYRQKTGHGDIFAATLAIDGTVRSIRPIATGRRVQSQPAAVPIAQGFLLTWSGATPSGSVTLRGEFIAPETLAENVSPAILWTDLGDSGYAVSASNSGYSAVALAQMHPQDASSAVTALRIELKP